MPSRKKEWKIIDRFKVKNEDWVMVRMEKSVHFMPETEWRRTERSLKRRD